MTNVQRQPDVSGLSGDEALQRLRQLGPNSTPDTSVHPVRSALGKFWAPVPWMLEAVIAIELALHDEVEAAVIAVLLIFNAALSFFQESRAQATLAALKSRLALTASVRRDGVWGSVPAANLVVGDIVKLSLGGVVAADVRLLEGSVLLDQSMLTGESVPIEGGPGLRTYAGALVRRGEATAVVTATGARTRFGRTAELVRTAHVVSTQQTIVFRVARNLAVFNGGIIVLLVSYAWAHAMPLRELAPLVLTAVLTSIPVALPATFTLAEAIGAKALAKAGVLPTRLSAVDEAATMDVLCVDKTGTLTQNALTVEVLRPFDGFDEAHVLGLAALASSDGGQDAVDGAIRAAASRHPAVDLPTLIRFVPFDPATKMSEALTSRADGAAWRIVKGAFSVVSGITQAEPAASGVADALEAKGYRVLAVAAGPERAMRLVGVIALGDPPRADSAGLVTELNALGVRTIMVTGDAPATAAIVARAVGLDGAVCPSGTIPDGVQPETFGVFAGVLPGQVSARPAISAERPHGRDVRRRRERCAGVAPGAHGDCRLDSNGCRQVCHRNRAHRGRSWRDCDVGEARARDRSAHPDLYPEIGDPQIRGRTVSPRGDPDDRACGPHAAAARYFDDHGRSPFHARDDG
jgi:H+-transporting ATPase